MHTLWPWVALAIILDTAGPATLPALNDRTLTLAGLLMLNTCAAGRNLLSIKSSRAGDNQL